MQVGDEFRVNPHSFVPGGSRVIVVESTGFTKQYDKVKYPKAYVDKIPREGLYRIYVDEKLVWENTNGIVPSKFNV